MSEKIGIGIIGAGNIASPYVKDLLTYPEIEVLGVSDLDSERKESFAAEHGIRAYSDNAALLVDEAVQIIVNLTPHFAHKSISEQALLAGKHVYSEKPLALLASEAWELVELAEKHGLRLACSPFTVIGEAQQTAWKMIRDGKLGKVRMVYAEANWGRIEAWHPAPIPFYEVGAMFDVGVYLLGLVTSFFGPVRQVFSLGAMLQPERHTKEGDPFQLTTPDWMVTMLEMADGTRVRLTTDFYVSNETTLQRGLEIHGDVGSLQLDSFFLFNSPLKFAPFGESLEAIPLVREPQEGIPWGTGVLELANAIRENRPHRFGGDQAAHITDILNACNKSLETGQAVEIQSDFVPPQPAEWAQ